ncbi:uncharacterized protein LOC106664251 isoform X1 [Cimex lectularius]|uniref:Uncharacterized protein n=2 Tax=Cimex lectularius TaxID=79782 RepID=A0A8I6SP86_CIMLE|nr:uncharacterized protein LOC106664251 isoform X1 [Cimex lectularius]XP_024082292.1 uncharacterized protein LOC106664251 isoform X1 [Cimex lectularius]XP_024082293.1 uncharacterized protein LOC106664251 isoform X1 [Cimex lectularius]XP_024082294.1 uncharacterized protein LOC106664251 isoform X1 [Cimex lectularius]XP_024082295.1 uncharacterized protein LOC106664251 isoform X1 [Cimex lectularius]XP_024082296.1 uncharacterized protein LOC106664251 isoform X1 [Cimex lectularius]
MAKPNEHDTRKDKNHPKSQQDADNSNEPKWTKIPPPKEYLEEKRYYTDPYVVPGNYQKMTEYVSPPSYKPRSHSRESKFSSKNTDLSSSIAEIDPRFIKPGFQPMSKSRHQEKPLCQTRLKSFQVVDPRFMHPGFRPSQYNILSLDQHQARKENPNIKKQSGKLRNASGSENSKDRLKDSGMKSPRSDQERKISSGKLKDSGMKSPHSHYKRKMSYGDILKDNGMKSPRSDHERKISSGKLKDSRMKSPHPDHDRKISYSAVDPRFVHPGFRPSQYDINSINQQRAFKMGSPHRNYSSKKASTSGGIQTPSPSQINSRRKTSEKDHKGEKRTSSVADRGRNR